jgi:hypothetical protein
MHVIKPEQDLLRDLLDKMARDTFGLMALNETKETLAEDFENHADVNTIGTLVPEVIEQ